MAMAHSFIVDAVIPRLSDSHFYKLTLAEETALTSRFT